jgi:hypothetical protein
MRMAVITKSYAPNFKLCAALKRSVIENSPDAIQHRIVVPRPDLKLFGRLAGSRTRVRCEADFLPRSFIRVSFSNIMVNLRQPFPLARGWIQQQVISWLRLRRWRKTQSWWSISDVEFVRPFTAEMFVRDGAARFYCW